MSRAGVGVVVMCPCGEVYELRLEYAGRLLECPSCGRHLRAGPPPNAVRLPTPGVDHAFDRDIFLLRERVFTITSKYEVWAEDGTPILYVERPTYPVRTLFAYLLAVIGTVMLMGPAMGAIGRDGSGLLLLLSIPLAAFVFLVISMSVRPRRHVTIYRDESRRETLLRVTQDQRVALLTRTYTIVTAAGETLAILRKTYLHNIIRKRWYVTAPGGKRWRRRSRTPSCCRCSAGSSAPSSDSSAPTSCSFAGTTRRSSASSTGSSPCWIATCSTSRPTPGAPSTGGSPWRSGSCSTRASAADVSAVPEPPLRITPDMLLSRRVDFERRMGRVPPVTVATVVLLAAIFAAEVRMGALESSESIVAMGALARERVVAGEVWRLLTAPWLHGGLEHLVGNAIALYILGMVCEAAFGRGQLIVLYVLSGLAGSIVSLLVSPGPSVGASGAIFGLQGAAIVLLRRQRDRLLVRDRRVGFVLLIWAIYSIAGGLTDPFIDNGAHIGGALGGALIASRLHPVVLSPMPAERAATMRRWLGLVVALLAYGVVGWIRR